MGKFNTRNGLSSLANSDVLGQLSINGGGASIPLLIDGATNRLLTLSDTNSGSVFEISDADGNQLFDVSTTAITVGGNYTLPLTDGSNGQVLQTNGSGAVTFSDPNNVVASTRFIEGTNTESVTKGDPVYVSGESGGKPEFSKSDANDDPYYPAVGLVTETQGVTGSDIIVQTFGVMSGLNTVSYSAGDTLYVASGGGFDDTTYAADGRTQVGFVLTSHVSDGEVYINTTNLDENRYTLDYVTDRGSVTTNSIGASALTATNTNNGSGIVTGVTLFRDSDSPADGDALMRLSFNGRTSSGSPLTYASIWGIADAVTSGSEVGRLRFRTYNGTSFWDTGLEVHEGTISIGDTDPYTMPSADGTSGQVLTTDGAGTASWVDNAIGNLSNVDVTGATSGDVLLFNGTNWVDGSISVTTANISDVSQGADTAWQLPGGSYQYLGTTSYDYVFDGPRAGFLASNMQSGGLDKGQPVYRVGVANDDEITAVGVMASTASQQTIGLAYVDSDGGDMMVCITNGLISGMDTSSYTTGDTLYVDGNTSALVSTPPTGFSVIPVATVVYAHATEGCILVNVDANYGDAGYLTGLGSSNLQELNNVDSGQSHGDFLQYNTISAKWEPTEISIDDLSDVDTTTAAPSTNDVLKWNGSNWVPGTGGGSQTLDDTLTAGNTTTQSMETGAITATVSDLSAPLTLVTTTDLGALWPSIEIKHESTTPANNDNIGSFKFTSSNDADEEMSMAEMRVVVEDVTDGAEKSQFKFYVRDGGSQTLMTQISDDGLYVAGSGSFNGLSSSTSTDDYGLITTRTASGATDWDAIQIGRVDFTYANNRPIGSMVFNTFDTSNSLTTAARVTGVVVDTTALSVDGALDFYTTENGTETRRVRVDNDNVTIGEGSTFYTLPLERGSNNQVLLSGSSGTVTWQDMSMDNLSNVTIVSPSGNQVLKYDPVDQRWENGPVPVPTLAEVTAAGASTTTTLSLAQVLQTGAHVNVATSGNWFSQFRAKTLEVGATTGSLAYTLPTAAGTDGQVITMQSGTNTGWEDPVKTMTFWNQGIYQLSTSNDTLYRFSTGTSYPNYGLWNSTSSTVPSSLTRTPQRSKGGHIIPFDITGATITAKVGFAVGTNTALSSSASEYLGDTINFAVYRWPDNGSAVLIDEFTGTINGGNTTGEEEAEITITGVTLNEGDSLQLVSRCLQEASSTRYMAINYTFHIEY